MKKKERLEYYKLVEPKLREIFISNGHVNPSVEEFEKFNITRKHRIEFLDYYKDSWFAEEHYNSDDKIEREKWLAELVENLSDEEKKYVLITPNKHLPPLTLPSSSALFQICKDIDVKAFYKCLEERDTFIVVNKVTGMVTGGSTLSTLSISLGNLMKTIKKDSNQYEIFEIEDHEHFCQLLDNGDFKKIKQIRLFQNEVFEVPNDYPLSSILNRINLYDFADILNKGKSLIKYDKFFDWYSSYEDVKDYYAFNNTYGKAVPIENYTPLDRAKDANTVWFIAENPLQIRQEILYGNFKILKRIKIIENIDQFFMQ